MKKLDPIEKHVALAKNAGKTVVKTDVLNVGDGPNMRILAIDQGLTLTGFAFWEKGAITQHGTFKPSGSSLISRSISLEDRVRSWIKELKPALVVHETCGAMARNAQAVRGVILAEYSVDRACLLAKQRCASAHQELVKSKIASKTRLIEMKRKNLRDSLRPMKSDVRQAICDITGIDSDYFLSNDHADAIGIMLFVLRHFDCLDKTAFR